jgi:hypothetical protein
VSWYDGVPISSLYVGPPQDYPAAAAASAAAQSLVTGASGGFSQPSIPVGFFPLDKQGRAVIGHLGGKVTGQATATTAIFTIGLATAANSIATGAVTLVTLPAITITSLSNVGWEIDFKAVMRGAGYGTTTVATTLATTAIASVGSNLQATAAPNVVTTVDASVTQWLWASVTFSTASATNSATMQSAILYGVA